MSGSLARAQLRYQNDILTNYVHPTGGFLIGEWSHKEGNAGQRFENIEHGQGTHGCLQEVVEPRPSRYRPGSSCRHAFQTSGQTSKAAKGSMRA
jgi:hypothetical protein